MIIEWDSAYKLGVRVELAQIELMRSLKEIQEEYHDSSAETQGMYTEEAMDKFWNKIMHLKDVWNGEDKPIYTPKTIEEFQQLGIRKGWWVKSHDTDWEEIANDPKRSLNKKSLVFSIFAFNNNNSHLFQFSRTNPNHE